MNRNINISIKIKEKDIHSKKDIKDKEIIEDTIKAIINKIDKQNMQIFKDITIATYTNLKT